MIPATLRRWAPIIQDVDRDPDGWSVALKPGWFCEITETHAIYENTLAEIASKLKLFIVPCQCEECQMMLREEAK